MDRGAWQATVYRVSELDTTEYTHTHHRLGITFHLIPHEIHEMNIRTRKHSCILSVCRGVFLHREVREAVELTNTCREDP